MKQQLEQTRQHLLIQKQTATRKRIELESAIEELDTDKAWKVIGNIMVQKKPEELKKELQEQLATTNERLTQLKKQDERIQEKLKEHANN